MPRFSLKRFSSFLSILALAGLLDLPLAAQPAADEMLILLEDHSLLKSPLPAGPPLLVFDSVLIDHLLVLPNGQILATAVAPPLPGPFSGNGATLNELMPDGSLRLISRVVARGWVNDMALDPRGRLFLLTTTYASPLSSPLYEAIWEVDPATGARISERELPKVHSIATAPDGFWALEDGKLRKLDPDTLALGPIFPEFGLGNGLEVSSGGKLYFRPACTPPCAQIAIFDPATRVTTLAPESLYGSEEVRTFAIDRRCQDSATARCLQQGRYRAEIEYVAYDGAAGLAQAAPARSADTAIFSFFDPDNWELMVKVLDGCAINDHVWVYAAASTDVGYVMTITDTLTGAQKIYSNALGHVAETVTDGSAFPCLE